MAESDDGAWFVAKRWGIGAGIPIRWQGWAVLAGFLAGLVAARHGLHGAARAATVIALCVALLAVAARRTRGGWRWRGD